MNINSAVEKLRDELINNGHLCEKSLNRLAELIRSEDPFSAISLAGDCSEKRLIDDIAMSLQHDNPDFQWIAANVLFTRFRDAKYAETCYQLAREGYNLQEGEWDYSKVGTKESVFDVMDIAHIGLGCILPFINDAELRVKAATLLLTTLTEQHNKPLLQATAYEAILTALGATLKDLIGVTNMIRDYDRDIDQGRIQEFVVKYCSPDPAESKAK